MNKGVYISGSVKVAGDIVGGDLIIGGGGEVACDFIWKGTPFKGLCNREDQTIIQQQIDKYIDGKISFEGLKKRVEALAPNMVAVLDRLNK